eukprot:11920642-Alexandrium_andersonii.AAC.1
MQKLVYHVAESIGGEFNSILADDAISNPRIWGGLWQFVDSEDQQARTDAASNIVFYTGFAAADYNMRITVQMHSFPLKLCWLVFLPPGHICMRRKAVCRELLGMVGAHQSPANRADSVTWKVVASFENQIRDAADS